MEKNYSLEEIFEFLEKEFNILKEEDVEKSEE